MQTDVRNGYDRNAEVYARLFTGEVEADPDAMAWLGRFVDAVGPRAGAVADLGCGPGHVTDLLCRHGVAAVGSDISAGLLAEARRRFPQRSYRLVDSTALDIGDGALGGIVSRYSIIHMPVGSLPGVFAEWRRALAPGAPMLLSFFGARTPDTHAEAFDHKVVTAHALEPATIAELLGTAGFDVVDRAAIPIPAGGRPYDQATILARRST